MTTPSFARGFASSSSVAATSMSLPKRTTDATPSAWHCISCPMSPSSISTCRNSMASVSSRNSAERCRHASAWCSRCTTTTIIAAASSTPPHPGREQFPQLTDRDLDILERIAQGFDNAAIARELGFAPKTIRNLVSELFAKLGAADAVFAPKFASYAEEIKALERPSGMESEINEFVAALDSATAFGVKSASDPDVAEAQLTNIDPAEYVRLEAASTAAGLEKCNG